MSQKQIENSKESKSNEVKPKQELSTNSGASYKKKVFPNKFKSDKKRINNRKLKEKEERKQKRKFKRKFILPDTLSADGYKVASNLNIFITKYGKIERRKANKLQGKKYRKITKSIKNMRILGFIPFLKK